MAKNTEFNLNKAQLKAATRFYGPILCIAGAGTGKTKTLVYRVAKMLDSGIDPENVLLLTFTRNAAQSMLEQTAAIIGGAALKVSGGTYHGFAAQLIGKNAKLLGLNNEFNIITDRDTADLIDLIKKEKLPKMVGLPSKNRLYSILSAAFNLGLSVQEYSAKFYPNYLESPYLEAIELLKDELSIYKQENNLLDYDDLLFFLQHLLEEFPKFREQINEQYKFIMVDEYQDTNLIQGKITKLLAGPDQNLMVVGDDSQCIYSFRGAYVKNILDFPKDYPNCEIIKLEQNYRSLNSILKLANGLMERKVEDSEDEKTMGQEQEGLSIACSGFKKALFSNLGTGMPPVLAVCANEHVQAKFIISRIARLHSQGVPLTDMAVLFRAAFHSELLELELARHGIPYKKWGGLRFLDSKHLRDFLAILKLVNNPQDILSWLRVLCLIKGVGKKTADAIMEQIQVDYSLKAGYTFSSPTVEKAVTELLSCLQKASNYKWEKLGATLDMVVDYYSMTFGELYPEFNKKLKDLDQLVLLAEPYSNLQDFLKDLALEPPSQKTSEGAITGQQIGTAEKGALTISTIHSAKGLEWNSVFVMSVVDGLFPSHHQLEDLDALEEERRLLYVAITRGKVNLTLSYPVNLASDYLGSSLLRKSSLTEGLEGLLDLWHIRE